MYAKWAKAVFLIILGVILLFYSSGFVEDLETNTADEWNMSFEWTWDLLTWLLWVLVAWLFVDAALIIALSFKADGLTLADVMDRLDALEAKLSPKRERTPSIQPSVEPSPVVMVEEPGPEEEMEPPPPGE
jgi:hypothetical protein